MESKIERIIDIDSIFSDKKLDIPMVLEIDFISPISNVANNVNSNLACSKIVTVNKIYGILENIIGFHFNKSDRDIILNKNKKLFKLDKKTSITQNHLSKCGYLPLLSEVVELNDEEFILVSSKSFYDYSSVKGVRGDNGHFKTSTYDHSIIQERVNMEKYRSSAIKELKERKLPKKDYTDALSIINKKADNMILGYLGDRISLFYNTNLKREYLIVDEKLNVKFKTNMYLANLLLESNRINKTAYLGNSESIVSIKIKIDE